MAPFHFFADIDLLSSQAATDAFGPVSGASATQFQVTSIHRPVTGTAPNAYAVCDGLVLVQDAGNNLVNLVLKPTQQPPFAFPKISYFIYRGLQKSSLVNGNDVAPSANNDLTRSIWESQQAKNARAGTSDNPPAKALGIGISGSGPIEEAFYPDNAGHQLPFVRSGWSLGELNPTAFGFEIMLEAVGFDPQLPTARAATNIVTVPALPASPTQAQSFEYWQAKEAILNYIDPCAFFGGFQRQKLKVGYADGTVTTKKGTTIYDAVLVGSHLTGPTQAVFFNRNRTYLDIRNEYSHSINYFKNYGSYSNTDIQCGFGTGTSLSTRNYYAIGWPLMIVDNGDLPPANTSSRKTVFRLALPDGAGDNPLPTLYVSAGYLNDSYPREPKDKAKLVDLTGSSGFTTEVALAIPNRPGLASTTAISSYIRLKYLKRFDPAAATLPSSSGTVIRARSFLDNLFAPFDLKIPFAGPTTIKSVIFDADVFVDMSRTGGYDYIGSVGILDDGSRYTLILNPRIVRTASGKQSRVESISGETVAGAADVWSLVAAKLPNMAVRKSILEFSDPANNIEYLQIADDEDDPSPPDLEPYLGLLLISCSKAALMAVDKTAFWPKSPIYLGAKNLVRYADSLGQEYWSFDISFQGYRLSGNDLQVHEVASEITIYLNGDLSRSSDIQVGHEGTTAQASPLPVVPPVPPIKHVFVLMLENRSFDHMLGFSNISGIDAVTGLATTINGATSDNPNEYGANTYRAKTPADFQVDHDPPHEFMDVLRQLCGTPAENGYDLAQGDYPPTNNQGFAYSYATGSLESDPPGAGATLTPGKVMNCFDPAQVPVLVTLAEKYAVCDNWFSSVPGPTWPNRFFVHAATSGGLATSPASSKSLASLSVAGFDFANGHLYDRLDDRRLEWRVYEGDEIPQVFSLAGMNWDSMTGHYRDMVKLAGDLAKPTFAPTYVFIEPDYDYNPSAEEFLDGNSQHPRDDVRPGEMLIKQVYESIRNSSHWINSVLIITYDEHGGFHDHAAPPPTVAPGDGGKYRTKGNHFTFDRLGVRVPTVIVSPLIPQGTIDHTLYDHASILATLGKMFRLKPLTKRDAYANDFRHLFSLTIPRIADTDAPRVLEKTPPKKFPNAAPPEDTDYRDWNASFALPPITLPGGGMPIDSPIYHSPTRYRELDLKKALDNDPSLILPTELSGDHGPDLLAWLHVAFRRRLGVRLVTDELGRKAILTEYCSVHTVEEAEQFIEKARQEVRTFRLQSPLLG